MGSTIYIYILYSVIKENNNCYWSAILTLDKAALESALPLYRVTSEYRCRSRSRCVRVECATISIWNETHTFFGPWTAAPAAAPAQAQAQTTIYGRHSRLATVGGQAKTPNKMCLGVRVCVCGGKFVIVLPCHRSEWAVPALCMSERERTTASGSGRGSGRASARRVFVEFLFWHLTEDAAATPMRRLSDKICCFCSSLLPPPSLPFPTSAHCVCVFAHIVEIVLCSCCAFCLTICVCPASLSCPASDNIRYAIFARFPYCQTR